MTIKQFIPSSIKTALKQAIPVTFIDQFEIVTGQRDSLTPPKRLHFVGGGDFKSHGDAFFGRFREIGDLQPTDRVLDVGSGVGRLAVPLAQYLTTSNCYEGIEIVKDGVDWCQQFITKKYPAFRFGHLNIYNKTYNPAGQVLASDIVFPFPADSFTFCFLTSVFTHMLEKDVVHYLKELYRVLKPGGRVYFTLFLLNTDSRRLIDAGRSSIALKPFTDLSMVESTDAPENAIAFDETFIVNTLAETGFVIKGGIRYGYWSGRTESFYDYQDTLVVTR